MASTTNVSVPRQGDDTPWPAVSTLNNLSDKQKTQYTNAYNCKISDTLKPKSENNNSPLGISDVDNIKLGGVAGWDNIMVAYNQVAGTRINAPLSMASKYCRSKKIMRDLIDLNTNPPTQVSESVNFTRSEKLTSLKEAAAPATAPPPTAAPPATTTPPGSPLIPRRVAIAALALLELRYQVVIPVETINERIEEEPHYQEDEETKQ